MINLSKWLVLAKFIFGLFLIICLNMLKKIFFRLSFFLLLPSLFLINVSASDLNKSDIMSCSDWVLSNSTTYENKVFDCDINIWENFKALNNSDIGVKWNLKLLSNAQIDWNLIVYWNLEIEGKLNIGWNLIVIWNIIWKYSNLDIKWYIKANNIEVWWKVITQAIISTWFVSIWSDSVIKKWIITDWYLKTWDNLKLSWISLIRWSLITWDKFNWSWTIYVYWNFAWKENYTFDWTKIKVTKDFKIGTKWTNKWRIVIFWKTSKWDSYRLVKKNLGYLIWEIDPLLKYSLTDKEFTIIKNRTIRSDKFVYFNKIKITELNNTISKLKNSNNINTYNRNQINDKVNQLNTLKSQTIKEYISLFEYLDQYIENEDFDIDEYNSLKEKKLLALERFLNSTYWDYSDAIINKITKKKVWIINVVIIEEEEEDKKEEKEEEKKKTPEEIIAEEKAKYQIYKQNLLNNLSISLLFKLDTVTSKITDADMEKTYKKIIQNIDYLIEDKDESLSIDRYILEWIKVFLENDLEERKIIKEIFW